jgi:hypothetical protein
LRCDPPEPRSDGRRCESVLPVIEAGSRLPGRLAPRLPLAATAREGLSEIRSRSGRGSRWSTGGAGLRACERAAPWACVECDPCTPCGVVPFRCGVAGLAGRGLAAGRGPFMRRGGRYPSRAALAPLIAAGQTRRTSGPTGSEPDRCVTSLPPSLRAASRRVCFVAVCEVSLVGSPFWGSPGYAAVLGGALRGVLAGEAWLTALSAEGGSQRQGHSVAVRA